MIGNGIVDRATGAVGGIEDAATETVDEVVDVVEEEEKDAGSEDTGGSPYRGGSPSPSTSDDDNDDSNGIVSGLMAEAEDAADTVSDTAEDVADTASDTVDDVSDTASDTAEDARDVFNTSTGWLSSGSSSDDSEDLTEEVGDAVDDVTAEGIVEETLGEDSYEGDRPSPQENVQTMAGWVTGAENEEELAEQAESVDEGVTEFLDENTEGTALDNEATDAVRWAGDAFIGDPLRAGARTFADVDPETGEGDAEVSAWGLADVALTLGTAGTGGILAKGAGKGVKSLLRGSDDVAGIFARGSDDVVEAGAKGSDDVAETAKKGTTDPMRPFASGVDDAGETIADRLKVTTPSAGKTAAGAGLAGVLAGGGLTTIGFDGSSGGSDGADDSGSGDGDSGDEDGDSTVSTTPPFITTDDRDGSGDGDDSDGSGDGDDDTGTEWGELENVAELDGDWMLARQFIVDGDRSRYFVLGGPTGSAYLQSGGSTVSPGPNESLKDMPSYNTEDDARAAHAAWVEENSRGDDEDDEGSPWSKWRELQKSGPWHVYSRTHNNEDRVEFKAAGKNSDGDVVYLAPDGEVVDEPHVFDAVDALTSALEAYSEDDTDEEDRPTGARPSNTTIRSDGTSDDKSDGEDKDGGIIGLVTSNPLVAAGAAGAVAVGAATYGGEV